MKMPALIAVTLFLVSAASGAETSSLSDAERAAVRAVDAHNDEAVALLRRIVEINSGTMNFDGVRKVGAALRTELDALGFTTRWVDGAAFDRAGHLVAEHRGPGAKLLLIGHLDTVFEPAHPFQHWESLGDSTARGPGIIDMKGGDVIIVYAMRALKDAGLLDAMNIVIVFNGDEEAPGAPVSAARRTLTDAAQGAFAAIGFEDGAGDPRTAVISRRGSSSWILRTTGSPAHSSQIFTKEVGAGAIYEAARILNAFYTTLSSEPYLTFNPGVAVGGTAEALDGTGTTGSASGKSNVVAKSMEVSGDLRTLSPEQLAHAKSVMKEIVAKHLPNTTAEITFDDRYPPLAPSAGNKRLLEIYDRASRDLGLGAVVAVDPSRAGAADVSFTAGIVPMAIDGIGLSGHDDHTDKETGDLRMLAPMTRRAVILLYRVSQSYVP